ncbi:hypothetical protein M3Y99_00507500 [Aphelenchoides fujianensis]|nr:hypothetical protein M3Y99_00507500 [Aphelenchoides fujianensis]
MESVKGGMYTSFEEFNGDVQKVLMHSPKTFRYVIKPMRKDGKLVAKCSNNIKTLQYVIGDTTDFKKLDQLSLRIMQYTTSDESSA